MTKESRVMFEVANQPPPLEPYNLFASDTVLRECVTREKADWAEGGLQALGATLGKPETIKLGFDANRFPPQLKTLDRYGHRLDEVEFHPAWHELMAIALRAGLHSSPWAKPQAGAHVARAAGTYMLNQIESGVYCPIAMTYGSVPTLQHAPDVAAVWLPKIYSRDYDKRFMTVGQKSGALLGMGMTENQGGSDLRTNATRAEATGDGSFRLYGHKWFMSAPMCDGFLVLAQSGKGLSCFLMPRFAPDGTRNAIRILRLKDKLGNKSNASSEVEFEGAYAQLIGEEGRGIPTIIEMGNHTRLECSIGSSSLMRAAVVQAIHHARHRVVFQKKLVDQPLMTNVLADLALECEAATMLTFRLARAYDEDDDVATVFRRVVTPAAKFWICKRTPNVTLEAMEVLGGSGYIEESVMPRLYREAPVNSIWEGSGNVMCLDVLRALGRTANAAEILHTELRVPGEPRLKAFAGALEQRLLGAERNDEAQARALVRDLVLALQAALLIKHAPAVVADAFCASRLSGESGGAFGTLPRGVDTRAIIERAGPVH
ncbi:isovaleryl-CoA dehydrogenase [Undibacter mobilis]|uniref:Isovaleryl-CoA dehydrogenase n=2 Tax=Undibacter mobilis TaxID=2292256 RepID=A0A371BDB5_9BRAD|nr:isovaleryl-CoA dehydrogenase [Undibacter mobilis]